VELAGHTGFKGGLDSKRDTTGTHSVYTKYQQFEIMFHVSSMLPFQEMDEQKVERKRHLGNDIVILVFKEGNTPFDPTCLKSHFNHIFMVVQVHEPKVSYRISVATKSGVEPYGPYISNPPLFAQHTEATKHFILTKLINGERAAMRGGEFRATLIRTRNDLMVLTSKNLQLAKGDTSQSTPPKQIHRTKSSHKRVFSEPTIVLDGSPK